VKISRTRQVLTAVAIPIAIALTLLCGVVLALTEGQSAVSERPSPTPLHIATSLPVAQASAELPGPTIVVIPTGTPAQATTAIQPPTATSTPTHAPALAGSKPCQPSQDWITYRVQPGDTLFVIGLRYGLTVTTIMNANCLDKTVIHSGDMVFVPPVTPRTAPGGVMDAGQLTTPPPTGTQTATDGACTDPGSVISMPHVGAVLRGDISIIGTARIPNFAFYKIEIRQEGTDQPYGNLYTGAAPVVAGPLAQLDTSMFPSGEYWLRLVVVDATSNYPERCAILVTLFH
jgi:LysM repeat protein